MTAIQPTTTQLHTPGEVAAMLGINRREVRRRVLDGRLPGYSFPGFIPGHRIVRIDGRSVVEALQLSASGTGRPGTE